VIIGGLKGTKWFLLTRSTRSAGGNPSVSANLSALSRNGKSSGGGCLQQKPQPIRTVSPLIFLLLFIREIFSFCTDLRGTTITGGREKLFWDVDPSVPSKEEEDDNEEPKSERESNEPMRACSTEPGSAHDNRPNGPLIPPPMRLWNPPSDDEFDWRMGSSSMHHTSRISQEKLLVLLLL
jgi:hypothetical protein